ncbi:MAG: hypothetical protein V1836_01965 [Candidatus Aenigmatarchaeota archaeon]
MMNSWEEMQQINNDAMFSVEDLRLTLRESEQDPGKTKQLAMDIATSYGSQIIESIEKTAVEERVRTFHSQKQKQILTKNACAPDEIRDRISSLILSQPPSEYWRSILSPLDDTEGYNTRLMQHVFVLLPNNVFEGKGLQKTNSEVAEVMGGVLYKQKKVTPLGPSESESNKNVTIDLTPITFELQPDYLSFLTGKIINGMKDYYEALRKFEEGTRSYRREHHRDKRAEITASVITDCMRGMHEETGSDKVGYCAARLNTHLAILRRETGSAFAEIERSYRTLKEKTTVELDEYIRKKVLPSAGYTETVHWEEHMFVKPIPGR